MKVNIDEAIRRAEGLFQYARANKICTGFDEFVLPPGCAPPTSKLAFDWQGNTRLLMIEPGIHYSGSHKAFRDYAQSCVFRGDSTEAVEKFLRDIKGAYSTAPASNTPPAQQPPKPANPLSPDGSNARLHGVVDISLINAAKPPAPKLNEAALLAGLQAEVVGQKQALETIVSSVSAHIGKRKPRRPPGIFIAGQSGTGKTSAVEHLAKLLPEHTGMEWGYIRVDANLMGEKHAVARLIGAPPGYVGYLDTPLLAPITKNPHHILLFDEIEKADPEVMTTLMSILDSGRMNFYRPVSGKTVCDCSRALIFFTSNLPIHIENAEEKSAAEITRAAREQLTKPIGDRPGMPKEIVARLSEVVLFRELSEADKVEILALSMLQLAEQYELEIRSIDPALLQDIVNKSSLSNGVREPQYILNGTLGKALGAFANDHDCKDVTLSGAADSITVTPYLG